MSNSVPCPVFLNLGAGGSAIARTVAGVRYHALFPRTRRAAGLEAPLPQPHDGALEAISQFFFHALVRHGRLPPLPPLPPRPPAPCRHRVGPFVSR